MASWPVDLIKGHRNVRSEKMTVQSERETTRARIDAIRAKVNYLSPISHPLRKYVTHDCLKKKWSCCTAKT